MTLTQPLELQTLLVNTLAGSMTLFIIIMVIVIASLAAKFRMNSAVFGLVIALFAVLVGFWANWFMFLIVLIGGFALYFVIGKLLRT